MVAHLLPKQVVAGSNPVSRSKKQVTSTLMWLFVFLQYRMDLCSYLKRLSRYLRSLWNW